MENLNFYNNFVSDKLFDLLKEKGFPITTIPKTYTSNNGSNIVRNITVLPTYKEVFDWLHDNSIEVDINDLNVNMNLTLNNENVLNEFIDKVIELMLDFI